MPSRPICLSCRPLPLALGSTGDPPRPSFGNGASYGANRLGLEAGWFIHIDLCGANEEYAHLLAVDPDNQTFGAVVTGDHLAGENVRPAIWPTPVMNEGDDFAFDILAVASPETGSELTCGDPDVRRCGNVAITALRLTSALC